MEKGFLRKTLFKSSGFISRDGFFKCLSGGHFSLDFLLIIDLFPVS